MKIILKKIIQNYWANLCFFSSSKMSITWNVTCNTWCRVNILSKFQLSSFNNLWFMMFWRFGGKAWLNQKLNILFTIDGQTNNYLTPLNVPNKIMWYNMQKKGPSFLGVKSWSFGQLNVSTIGTLGLEPEKLHLRHKASSYTFLKRVALKCSGGHYAALYSSI